MSAVRPNSLASKLVVMVHPKTREPHVVGGFVTIDGERAFFYRNQRSKTAQIVPIECVFEELEQAEAYVTNMGQHCWVVGTVYDKDRGTVPLMFEAAVLRYKLSGRHALSRYENAVRDYKSRKLVRDMVVDARFETKGAAMKFFSQKIKETVQYEQRTIDGAQDRIARLKEYSKYAGTVPEDFLFFIEPTPSKQSK